MTPTARLHRSPHSATEAVQLRSPHRYPRHSHDQYGIGLILSGAQRSFSGRGTVDAGAGDLIMVNPAEIHDGQPLHTPSRSWQMLYFDPTQFHALAHAHPGSGIAEPLLPPVSQDRALATLIQRLAAQLQQPTPDALAIDELETLLLGRLMRYPGQPAMPDAPCANIEPARQRLDIADAEPVRLQQLAEACQLSPFQLLRQFQRQLGITPHAYLVQRRLQLARRLLLGTLPLTEVALCCGFADQSHLTRAFKRQFGLTPGHYRQANRC